MAGRSAVLAGWMLAAGLAGAARAAEPDRPATGPVPAWVHRQAPAAAGKADGGAARILLQDQQFRFEPGASTAYSESAVELESPQGLPAGNVAFSWDPARQQPVVHHLRVRRGGKLIDLLATQSFTVLRREQNLESATLDGMLTATLQPEGLQVGDVVEFALSVTTRDPVLGAHVERVGGGWNGLAVGRAHLRAEWPAAMDLRFRQTVGLPALTVGKAGASRFAELAVDDLQPLPPPNGAPARFARQRLVEMTDWRSWDELGRLMAPLYAHAGTLPASGPLHDEWAKLDAGARDPLAKAAAMLAFVQDRVRYVALAMGAGGYVPADAALTWERRFGDCKAKTALLLGLLHASGIAAVPVAVNGSGGGDGLDQALPLVGLFNHVLVRATIGGRTYWLDGTRTGDTDLRRLRVPDLGWGVPLVAGEAAPVRLLPPPLERPDSETAIAIDATAGISLPAPFRVETVLRGDGALGTGLGLRNLTPEQRDKALRDHWREQYNFVEPATVDARYDPATGEERLLMTGTATLNWRNGWYQTDGTGLGWQADFHRDAGPDRDAPFRAPYPVFTRVKESITLPPGFRYRADKSAAEVRETVAGVEYRRTVGMAGQVFTVEATQRGVAPEFPAADAPAAQAALRRLADANVFLGRPADYLPTSGELAVATRATPTTADGFYLRGLAFAASGKWPEALADYSQGIALDPKNARLLASRGLLQADRGEVAAAEKDFAAAELLDARNPVLLRGRGMLAGQRGDYPAAIGLLTRALEVEPDNSFTLRWRALAYARTGRNEPALLDLDAALARSPRDPELYLWKVNVVRSMGRPADVPGILAAMLKENGDNGYAHVVAARTHLALDDRAAALREFDRALAIKPEAYVYLNRVVAHPAADRAARRADLEAALKLDPEVPGGLLQLFWLEDGAGRGATLLARLDAALARQPRNPELLTVRGIARTRAGQAAPAAQDFAAARAAAADPVQLNTMCWEKATHGVALPSALADCDAAIARQPDADFLDSRGLVNLRLGRLDAALADYDAALAKAPKLASTLYGRSLVRTRRGEAALAAADRQAALALAPRVGEAYAEYGLAPAPVAVAAAGKR